MHTPNQSSPMLKAIDFMRVNIDELDFPDLEAHAVEVLATIAALNDNINGPHPKSHNALLNALNLGRKLSLHMVRVRDLIQARHSAYSMTQAAQSASSPSLSGIPAMGRRSRVIRPLNSADNAASGPLEILGNKPTAWDTEARRGGEAKEAGAHPQSGEASLQAKR